MVGTSGSLVSVQPAPLGAASSRQLRAAARKTARPRTQIRARAELEGAQQQTATRPYPTAESYGDPFGDNPFLLTRATSAPLVRVAGQQNPGRTQPAAPSRAAVPTVDIKNKLLGLVSAPGSPPVGRAGPAFSPLALATGGALAEQIQEAIVILERENPAKAPAQEALDGVWHAVFASGASPGIIYAATVGNLPETKCKSLQLEISCKSTLCVATASFQTGFGQEVKLYTRSRWTAEGSVMIREEYEVSGAVAPTMSTIDSKALAEAIYSTSGVPELMQENIPTFAPATAAFISLIGAATQPIFNWAGTTGSKVPVAGLFERTLFVSYLDGDTMVLRDIQGAATVLRRGPAGAPAPVQEHLREAPVEQAPAQLPQAAQTAPETAPTSPLALPTSGLYAGLDPAIVAALTGRAKASAAPQSEQ